MRIGRWRQQCRCLVSRLPACTFQFVLKGDETTYNRLCIFWRRCFGLIAVAYFSGDSVNRKSVASEGNQHSWIAFTSHLAWASPVWSMTRRSIVSLQMTEGESDTTLREPSMPIHKFVQTSDEACSKSTTWSTWPQAQERAIENGTVLVWNVVSSIGHFMRTLVYILPVSDGQRQVCSISTTNSKWYMCDSAWRMAFTIPLNQRALHQDPVQGVLHDGTQAPRRHTYNSRSNARDEINYIRQTDNAAGISVEWGIFVMIS